VEVSWNIINCSGLEFDQYDEVRISEWRSCVVKKLLNAQNHCHSFRTMEKPFSLFTYSVSISCRKNKMKDNDTT
jgi:hypothetical protein